jgi:hypothetical protein
MDKLYSKKALAIKASCCALLGPFYAALNALIEIEHMYFNLTVPVLIVACLYTIPFWVTLAYIKKYRVPGIKKAIKLDALCCLLPACAGMIITETVIVLSAGRGAADGFITLVFAAVFVIISAVFWLLYKAADGK